MVAVARGLANKLTCVEVFTNPLEGEGSAYFMNGLRQSGAPVGLDLEHRVGLQVLLHHAVDTNQQRTVFKLLPGTFTSLKLGKAGDNKKIMSLSFFERNLSS